MTAITLKTISKEHLADTLTPVSLYLKLRDQFPYSVLLESSDYHGHESSYSFIGFLPLATFKVKDDSIYETLPGQPETISQINDSSVSERLLNFTQAFQVVDQPDNVRLNGLFGYFAYDSVRYFETIDLKSPKLEQHNIPDVHFTFYKYVITINHFKNQLVIHENLLDGETSNLPNIEKLINDKNFASFPFALNGKESSNISDQEYMDMVSKGKYHCHRGDVFQIVLSRQFSQGYTGDDFNLYRALRSINPSPYLYYFDYGNYRILGSSPEAQITVKGERAIINPIAGTFKRTGNDRADRELADQLTQDPKENAEHVMLVDLARNDLSRNCTDVKVDVYREVQFFSHVIHLVSTVSGKLKADSNPFKIMGDSFPAGTLSGAPKFKAMELIDTYENQNRGYYGGCIGYIGLNGDMLLAIMIRSFLSCNNQIFYQAGAGIVSESQEESELQEVNNKLAALKKAIEMAQNI